MGKLMKRVEEFAKSPKAKDLEKKMLRKAEDPKTRVYDISAGRRFRNNSRSCARMPRSEVPQCQGVNVN